MDLSARLASLPPNVKEQFFRLLPDPGALAGTCRAIAALLDQDELLLDWASLRAPARVEHRHPGYALLHWRPVHRMDWPRLVRFMQQWMARQAPAEAPAGNAAQVQQLLDAGDGLGALHALLPHSEHLLPLYAAHAGHTQLLRALIAARGAQHKMQLCWDDDVEIAQNTLELALYAAVAGGQVAAMDLLLAELQAMSSVIDCPKTAQLLTRAVARGTSSAASTAALIERSSGLPWKEWVDQDALVHAAACDSAALLAAVQGSDAIDVLSGSHLRMYRTALRHGHLHLLPLAKPTWLEESQAAAHICCSPWLSPASFPLLPQAMVCVRDGGDYSTASDLWCLALKAVIAADSPENLQAIWDAFADAPAHRAALGMSMVELMPDAASQVSTKAAEWLLQMVPEFAALSAATAGNAAAAERGQWACSRGVDAATLQALKHGHTELLAMLQAAAGPDGRFNADEHLCEQLCGQLLQAVRGGQADAVQAALQAMQALVADDWYEQLAREALENLATVTDPAAAVAVAEALGPLIDQQDWTYSEWFEVLQHVWQPHGGALVQALCGASEVVRGLVFERSNRALGEVCKAGMQDFAEWLVSEPRQHGFFLANVGDFRPTSRDCKYSTQHWRQKRRTFTALLHRLAAKKQHTPAAEDPAAGGGSGSREGSDDMNSDNDSIRGADEPGSHDPPAGARQLTREMLKAVVTSGHPDLVAALLVFMDAWRPASTAEL